MPGFPVKRTGTQKNAEGPGATSKPKATRGSGLVHGGRSMRSMHSQEWLCHGKPGFFGLHPACHVEFQRDDAWICQIPGSAFFWVARWAASAEHHRGHLVPFVLGDAFLRKARNHSAASAGRMGRKHFFCDQRVPDYDAAAARAASLRDNLHTRLLYTAVAADLAALLRDAGTVCGDRVGVRARNGAQP